MIKTLEVIEYTPLEMQTSSRLFNIEPIGIGTPLVESLPSYISRLAEAHCVRVGDLLNKEVYSITPKDYLQNAKIDKRIYGFSEHTFTIINALKELTHRKDLEYLTLIPWKDVFRSSHGIFKDHRTWCPECFNEQYLNGTAIYEPLIWNFQKVTHCPIHHNQLISVCPHCNKTLPTSSRKFRNGYCSNCSKWLGQEQSQISLDYNEQSIWYSCNIGNILSVTPTLIKTPSSELLTSNIHRLRDSTPMGMKCDFTKRMKIDKSTFDCWATGKTVPQFNLLLDLCYSLKLTLSEMILEEISEFDLINMREPIKEESKKNKINFIQLESYLADIINGNVTPIPSLSSICNTQNIRYQALHKHFPDQCKTIVEMYKEEGKINSQGRINRDIEYLRGAIKSIYEEGVPPTLHIVKKVTKMFIDLRPELMAAWKKTIAELGLNEKGMSL